ncbi:DEAD/DEAH box helicase [Cohnella fermenti]|uniref:DEAD/DEAH box helicase n=1 Tax=Cohnella fermenti TaxID=2565925 RepID=A0A4S4C968_9BACL|nr:DEAD/DEAH box helicase [Cohnella fermenti]THF84599.1 DEAD/DEAH box helicase [Cohnella fermenti]
MTKLMDTIQVNLMLTEFGDALLFASSDSFSHVPGLVLKHRLFAWHEPSLYGTELAVQTAGEIEMVLLPAEEVIPFFADRSQAAKHISWAWEERAADLIELAPLLAECLERKKFAPSLKAFGGGKLEWIWDESALELEEQALLADRLLDPEFLKGIVAVFSAAVNRRHYGTEAEEADLRREFPALFAANRAASAQGMDSEAWLLSIGWRADSAPFRPALQLIEPWEGKTAWRLRFVLQDKQQTASVFRAKLAETGEALGSWPEAWTPFVRERSAGWLERLRATLPLPRVSARGDDVLAAPLDDKAAWQFLTADSKKLLEAGWVVLLPAWWEAASRKKPRLRAQVRERGEGKRAGRSLFGLDAIIDFDWRVSIGDTELSEAEFKELVARGERLVRFRDRWVPLDPALLAQISRAMEGMDRSEGLSFQDVLQLHLLSQEAAQDGAAGEAGSGNGGADGGAAEERALRLELEVVLNEQLLGLFRQLTQQAEWPKLAPPAGLRAELRGYQRDGFSWLVFLGGFGLGCCLADDMGLGKTVQLISYLLWRKENAEAAAGTSLIVCPTSVLGNWQKEIGKFAPSLRVMLHYGGRRLTGEEFVAEASEADVVLTSFATAALDQELLSGFGWSAVCLDEAQNIKNAQTKQSAAVRSFPAKHRIALTGTPIENRLSELWSIYDYMNPGFLGTARGFQERFATPIEKDRDPKRTTDLQKLVKPFMLRRKKKDPAIQLDLPEKNEMKSYVNLTAEQSALYEQTVNELMERMKQLEGIERKGAILSALTRLKQLCDHPALLLKENLPVLETAGVAGSGSGPGAGSPSEPNDPASASAEPPLDVELLASRSSKLERLLAMVREIRDLEERCIIFTQYIGMGEMLRRVLSQELGEPVLYLNGSTSKTARDRMIDRFQSRELPPEEQPNVFILSLKAGGVGLNLTAANHVFHFDRWWNPAVENQATDRAYRMGQTRDVQVHKFIALGTLEERIDEMLESKQQLSDNVISASEGWITELSTEELKDLFTLRRS